MFTIIHLTGPGIGGQAAHMPSSNVLSKLRRAKGTTSVMPALVRVFFPHALNVAAAAEASGELAEGALGRDAKEAIVDISLWKWCVKGSRNVSMMATSLVPSNEEAEGRSAK
jgi:hypothetical protein